MFIYNNLCDKLNYMGNSVQFKASLLCNLLAACIATALTMNISTYHFDHTINNAGAIVLDASAGHYEGFPLPVSLVMTKGPAPSAYFVWGIILNFICYFSTAVLLSLFWIRYRNHKKSSNVLPASPARFALANARRAGRH